MNLESRLEIVNKHIKKLERCVTASEEGKVSPQLQQLRQLREEIKAKAKKDFLQVQSEVLDGFRSLMEKLTTLSFFASEAEQDNREIEKAISQMNKIKSNISDGILGLEEKKDDSENKATASAEEPTASVQDDVQKFVEQSNGKYYTVYQEWFDECKARNLSLDIENSTVCAIDENGDCLGRYSTEDMEGCLFENIEDYDKAFEEADEEEENEEAEEIDEDVVEEEDNA